MLTVKALENSSRAADYYQAADYYLKDDDGLGLSYWQGEGAKNLGLKGPVDSTKFKDLLDGKVDGVQLGRKGANGIEHKPGWDLPLSAPKGVSMVALIGNDKRLIAAVKNASDQTIAYIEKNFAVTRQTKNGKLEYINEKNLVCASFLQTTSRELDPQLHVHNVILNMLLRSDGQWRSIESKYFYDNQMMFGLIFRSILAKSVVELGYDIEVDTKTGFFDIKDVSKEDRDFFSKRRTQIIEAAKEHGVSGAKAMEQLNLITRKSKRQVSKNEIIARWDKEAKERNFDPKPIIDKALANTGNKLEQKLNDDNKYLTADYTVDICSRSILEMEAVCYKDDVFSKSLKLSLGQCTPDQIEKAIQDAIKEKKFYVSHVPDYNGMCGDLLTTKEAYRKEKYILSLMKQGQGNVRPIANEKDIAMVIKKEDLNKGQYETIKHITTSKDQILAVQGYAGTGKTTHMLRPATQILQNKGYKIRPLGAYNSTAQNLQNELGINAQTLSSFLYQTQKEINDNAKHTAMKDVLILDEASQVNANDMADLLTLVRKTKSRLILVGDRAQIGAVEWGKPFNLMLKNGINYSEMKEIVRQKDNDLKEAVMSAINLEYTKSLKLLEKDAVIGKSSTYLISTLVNDYFSQSDQDRANSLIVIPDNETRDMVMTMVRNKLIEKGEVSKTGFKTKIYDRAGYNRAEKSDARFYKKGHIVEFGKAYKSLKIADKEKLAVLDIKPENGLVKLGRLKSDNITVDSKKDALMWNPSKIAGSAKYGVEVYEVKEREFSMGDKIIWTNTIKKEGLKNGDKGEVADIVKKSAFVKFENGTSKWINTDKLKNFDYAYAATAHIAQGMTFDRVFAMVESWRKNLINQKSFYVIISRARHKTKIYTDNITKLIDALALRSGDKTSSTEFSSLVREHKKSSFSIKEFSEKFKQLATNKYQKISKKIKNLAPDSIKRQPDILESKPSPKKALIDAKEVEILLKSNVEYVCKQVLGDYNKKVGKNLYFGRNKGSLAITIRGEHIGKWTDFATGEKGNLITLIQKHYGLNFKEALEEAAKLVNYIPGELNLDLDKIVKNKINKDELDDKQKLSIKKAQKLASEAKDIKGTPAEKYLKDVRGIDLKHWSKDLKYHDGVYSKINKGKNPALLVVARDKEGKVQSVQAIYIDRVTGQKAGVEVQKQTFGSIKGALFSANISSENNKTAVICEGPEDALSILKSTNSKDIYACLGKSNFNNLNQEKLDKYDKIILALDNDGKKPGEMSSILNVASKLNALSKDVIFAQPDRVKQDYNDTLKTHGSRAVEAIISNGKLFDSSKKELKVEQSKQKIMEKEL
ncbi:MAG: conjugative relaxase [Rickettsiaceae bacterium]|nr:conjugative relaxase [Rickettsiaceae bacterium]